MTPDVPVTQTYRRIPSSQFEDVRQPIQELADKGVIQPSSSPYASPVMLLCDWWCQFLLHLRSGKRLPQSFNAGGGSREDSLHNTIWPVGVHTYALWTVRRSCKLPSADVVLHERLGPPDTAGILGRCVGIL